MVRCFIAVDTQSPRLINEAIRIQGAIKESKIRASFPDPHTLHITLKFLGEVSDERLTIIKESLDKIRGRPFTIYINGLGGFPNLRRPRVIFFDVAESEELSVIFRQVEEFMANISFPKESRRFKPHITLARIKSFRPLNEKLYNFLLHFSVQEKIQINDVRLKKSTLTPSGAIYSDIHIVPLE
jgi:2'-5' RNA ligase